MADEIKAKYVRMYAPGGAVLNFCGVTGDTHFAYPVEMTVIKKALERGILVFEELAEPAEDGSLEVQLTLENYQSNLSGKAVADSVTIVPDIEQKIIDTHAAEAEAAAAAQGLEIKAKQEKIVEEYNKANGIQTIEGTGQGATNPPGPGTDPPIPVGPVGGESIEDTDIDIDDGPTGGGSNEPAQEQTGEIGGEPVQGGNENPMWG